MKDNMAQELIQEIYINVQQPELTSRELFDSMTERSLHSFLLQFMKPYHIVYVHVYFPYPFILVVLCNLDLLSVVFVVIHLNAFDLVWRIELFKMSYRIYLTYLKRRQFELACGKFRSCSKINGNSGIETLLFETRLYFSRLVETRLESVRKLTRLDSSLWCTLI